MPGTDRKAKQGVGHKLAQTKARITNIAKSAVPFLFGLVMAGIGALSTYAIPGLKVGPFSVSAFLDLVGRSGLVAGTVGAFANYWLRKEYATEISRQTAGDLFRRFLAVDRAPDEYVVALQKIAHVERLGLRTSWVLDFSWVDEDKTIMEVKGRSSTSAWNISGNVLPIGDIAIQRSRSGAHDARFVYYSCSAVIPNHDDRKSPDAKQLLLDERSLAQQLDKEFNDAASFSGDVIKARPGLAPRAFDIPAGAVQEVAWSGITYRSCADYILLSTRYSCLRTRIELTGTALKELVVQLRSGSSESNEPVIAHTRDHFEFETGVTLGGAILAITWVPAMGTSSSSQQAKVQTTSERQIKH